MKNLVGFNMMNRASTMGSKQRSTTLGSTGGENRGGKGRVCLAPCRSSMSAFASDGEVVLELQGRSIGPGLTTYGFPFGLVEIRLEPSTNNGDILDPLIGRNLPSILTEGDL